MQVLDLFNTKYEKELVEGAVDDLQRRMVKNLEADMDDLLARARQAKDPEHKAALKREYENIRAKRDEVFGLEEAGLPDVADKADKMARLNQSGKAGTDVVTPQQRVNPNPNKGVIGHAVDWLRGRGGPGKEGPTYEGQELDEMYGPVGSKALMNGNFAAFLKAQKAKQPVDIVIGNDSFRLTPAMMNAMLEKYNADKAAADAAYERDDPKKRDIKMVAIDNYRAFGYPDLMKKFIDAVASRIPQQQTTDGGGEQLPLIEKEKTADSKKKIRDTLVSREIQKARAEYPSAASDFEAFAHKAMDTDRKQDQLIQSLSLVNKDLRAKMDQIAGQSATREPFTPPAEVPQPTTAPAAVGTVPTAAPAEPSTTQVNITPSSTTTTTEPAQAAAATTAAPAEPKADKPKKKKNIKYKQIGQAPRRQATPQLPDPRTVDVDVYDIPTGVDQPEFDFTKVKETKSSTIANRSIAATRALPKADARLEKHKQQRQDLERQRDAVDAEMSKLAGQEQEYWQKHAPRATRLKEPTVKLEDQNLDAHAIYIDGRLWKVFANATLARKEALKVIDSLRHQGRDQKVTVKPYIQGVTEMEDDDWDEDEGDFVNDPQVHAQVKQHPLPDQVLRAIERNPSMRADIIAAYKRKQGINEGETSKHAEEAMFKRILVKHRPLLREYGIEKVTRAIEDVAYNISNIQNVNEKELETWVGQVAQILGATPINEGWSDAVVAQRIGRPRTPYSVYIKGKKWKDFENEDHAENVANKLRAKFKAEGRDPSVITIAPTDYDVKEAISKKDLLGKVTKDANKDFKKAKAGKLKTGGVDFTKGEHWTGPKEDDPYYTKNFGHGYPNTPSNRSHDRYVNKSLKKGVAENFNVDDIGAAECPRCHYNDLMWNDDTQHVECRGCGAEYTEQGDEVSDNFKYLSKHSKNVDEGATIAYIVDIESDYGDKAKVLVNAKSPQDAMRKVKVEYSHEDREYDVWPTGVRPAEKGGQYDFRLDEAGNPAQQAAIAVAMKKAGKKPKHVDEMDKSQPSQERHGDYPLGAKGTTVKPVKAKKVVKDLTKDFERAFAKEKDVKESKEAVFKNHKIEVEYPEGKGHSHIYHRREPYRLSTIFSDANSVAYRNPRAKISLFVDGEYIPNYEWQEGVDAPNGGIGEAQTDFQKRRQRERDVDMGKPVSRQRQPKQTDYQKRRAQDKKDMELGEGDTVRLGDVQPGTPGYDAWYKSTHKTPKPGEKTLTPQTAKSTVAGAGKQDLMPKVVPEQELDEKWSQKYKKSINCANPKGFSQRAHCQGRKKK